MEGENILLRRILVRLLLGSFVVEVLLSEAVLRLSRGTGIADLLLDDQNLAVALVGGLFLAIVVALVTRFYFATFAREITEDLFRPVFANTTNRDVILLAVLPAIGEEILFRGVLQSFVGVILASLVFGFMHTGLSRRLLPYSIWTTVVGLLLGTQYLLSGNLWGSVVAHTLVNASGVTWIRATTVRKQPPESEGE